MIFYRSHRLTEYGNNSTRIDTHGITYSDPHLIIDSRNVSIIKAIISFLVCAAGVDLITL